MRLAIDLRPLLEPYESGVTKYTKSLVQVLQKRGGIELDLFYQARTRCPRIHRLFANVRHIPISNTVFHFRSLLRFPKLPAGYFKASPDIIWIPDRRPFYKTDIPLVMTIHDLVPERFASTLSVKGRLWHKIFSLSRLLSLCSGIITPSFSIAHSLHAKLPKEVTYEGADDADAASAPVIAKRILKKPFFLLLCPRDPRKHIDWFLKCAEHFPQMNFVWIGQKNRDSRFSYFSVKQLKNLFIYSSPTEEEKTWFIKHAKALLALSMYEGFDLPVLEAVRLKCPVIMSDIAVHRELYKGSKCFFHSLNDLKAAIYQCAQGKCELPTPRGKYTWEKAAERTLFFFFRILSDKNRNGGRSGNS